MKKIVRSVAAFGKSGAAFLTLLAFLSNSAGPLMAGPPDDRKHSEEAVKELKHIIIIYQENGSFDWLNGHFPGAKGYAFGFDTFPKYDVPPSPPYSQLIYKTPRPLNGGPDLDFPASPDGNLALWSNHNVGLP